MYIFFSVLSPLPLPSLSLPLSFSFHPPLSPSLVSGSIYANVNVDFVKANEHGTTPGFIFNNKLSLLL